MPCCSQLCCVEATQSTHKNSFANECCQVLLHEHFLCAEASGGSNTYRRQPIASSILHGRSPWQPLRSAASAAISLQRQEQRTRRTCCENSAWLLHRGGRRYALPLPTVLRIAVPGTWSKLTWSVIVLNSSALNSYSRSRIFGMEALLCGLFPRPPGGDGMSIMEARRRLEIQDARIDRLREKLEDRGEQIVDMRHAVSDMMDDLENMRHGAGRLRALSNVEKATNAVLNLSDTFDSLDKNSNGNIDLAELRRDCLSLGWTPILLRQMPSSSATACSLTVEPWMSRRFLRSCATSICCSPLTAMVLARLMRRSCGQR